MLTTCFDVSRLRHVATCGSYKSSNIRNFVKMVRVRSNSLPLAINPTYTEARFFDIPWGPQLQKPTSLDSVAASYHGPKHLEQSEVSIFLLPSTLITHCIRVDCNIYLNSASYHLCFPGYAFQFSSTFASR